MSILKTLGLSLFIATLINLNSVAGTPPATVVTVVVTNNTSSSLKLLPPLYGLEHMEAIAGADFEVGPGKTEILDLPYERNFTYKTSGWTPKLKKVAPLQFVIDYQVDSSICRFITGLNVEVKFGVLEPNYYPSWSHTGTAFGNKKYRCRTSISEKLDKPPYSYTVNFIVE